MNNALQTAANFVGSKGGLAGVLDFVLFGFSDTLCVKSSSDEKAMVMHLLTASSKLISKIFSHIAVQNTSKLH